ncbi:hypothetical protein ACW5XA_21825, partial [Aeromonas dhakensis]
EIRARVYGEAIEALPSHHPREITFPSAAPAEGGSDISREWPSSPSLQNRLLRLSAALAVYRLSAICFSSL